MATNYQLKLEDVHELIALKGLMLNSLVTEGGDTLEAKDLYERIEKLAEEIAILGQDAKQLRTGQS